MSAGSHQNAHSPFGKARAICRAPKEFIAGTLLVSAGTFAIWATSGLPIGKLSEAGPRFMPVISAALVILFGVAIIGVSFFRDSDFAERIAIRGPATVFAALLCFAVLVRPFGLFPACLLLIILSSLASPAVRYKELPIFAVAAALIFSVVFKYLLAIRLDFIAFPL